ncbi:hypothetical protein CW304_16990 [Bacillus sp. UFRGS-B20]|nr:hypothetical protein CW304_16990 [Bacillus sp. UFRGS-B20]
MTSVSFNIGISSYLFLTLFFIPTIGLSTLRMYTYISVRDFVLVIFVYSLLLKRVLFSCFQIVSSIFSHHPAYSFPL